ncbi:radical SAM protein [Streptomyces sp. TRM 70351]|uniref:radical SAM protein n=1 Tax=Streptomyces sp. TRM 70351 TaxID=3116552 RepID=UPI002E7B2201|nr:radical SAM protein [Streptomyces sp. TRM 70351]MEE1928282.1 radical SAM protein [Streptomyces sp. TRM 70351]
MRRLSFADLEEGRERRGTLALLFITDRCPVGCGHCSVDSRPDSPRITDFALFEEVVEGLCALPDARVVGISGGEPFIERRGLTYASRRITEAGKDLILYTSGFWGPAGTDGAPGTAGADGGGARLAPEWARAVLRRASTVYLSTDAYHEESVHEHRFAAAARAVAAEDVWLVVQVMNEPRMVERAGELLRAAFGPDWASHAEVATAPPLPYGRAGSLDSHLFRRERPRYPAESFGKCQTANVPVIRYDGTTTMCCNEMVITGAGPARLRRRCTTREEVTAALGGFTRDSLYRAIGTVGPGLVTAHPRYQDLAGREFASVCELCWVMAKRAPEDARDNLIDAIRVLGEERVG